MRNFLKNPFRTWVYVVAAIVFAVTTTVIFSQDLGLFTLIWRTVITVICFLVIHQYFEVMIVRKNKTDKKDSQ